MITIYESNEIDFTHNGLGVLTPVLCDVTEVLNGIYEVEMEHFIDDYGRWQKILEGNIIKVPTPRGEQLFRIYRKRKTMLGILINARHIFFDLCDNFLVDVRPTALNGAGAIDWILSHTQYPHRFRGTSDISSINSAEYIRKNPAQALISDDENSFLNKWGGELLRDNFDFKIMQHIGEDRGVKIQYGKNLLGLECDTDIDSVVTRVMPTGLKADNTILILPETFIDSPLINNYPSPKVKEYHFQDVKVSDELTESQALELLRQKARELFEKSKIDIPPNNTRVDFIELSKTEEYKNYQVLETIYLADTVTIKHTKLGIDLKAKAIKYKYDAILKRYKNIELGDFKANFIDSTNKVNKILGQIQETIKENKSDLQAAIDNATNLLTTAMGGYVLKRENEILIMDTQDVMTAKKVWRWNINGLGYSSTGYNGQFALAMTMDGAIVADFITAGVFNGNLIKAGTIKASSLDISIVQSIDSKAAKDYVDTQFQVQAGLISAKVATSNLSTEIQARAGDVQVAFNNITSNIQNAGGTFSILNGRLVVKNGNSEVCIDGQYNMHKIIASGYMDCYLGAGYGDRQFDITHNMGYKPCFAIYMDADGGGYANQFPIIRMRDLNNMLIGGVFRAGSNNSVIHVTFSRDSTTAMVAETIKIRYYIYKEVAL